MTDTETTTESTDVKHRSQSLLRIEDVYKSYGDERVLRGVSLEIDRGDVEVLVGPSGSGKSTLLRCLNRLTEVNDGQIYLGDLEVTGETNADEIRQQIGMVFQDINLFAHLTARKNIMLGLQKVRGMDKEDARDRADAELARVGLADQAESYPAQLSGGQKQRVGIARALAMDPEVMLFDEPTSALDPELSNEVLAVMRELVAEGMTMVVVTHEMRFARGAASSISFLENGEIVERGSPDRMFDDPTHERTKRFFESISHE
ncbi:amino acid ABC transporter ATP-binding protein [Natrarchaeobaculum sulfurireducens]|uniref:ABC-type polar amino acid transport system, ATPase component n=1 Tax=Natrarchaeobaculum sulfurireducens TaxID=2044521 RepID=A0A346PLD1_9EURY|nr:amino acid ABC transporter ATP-binding protein [Natrarchaeobaculum sulfurireducens]AXR76656.1 ABC-type polar amino acid transport system, ATPase component [Natrarchaeobaculum sulfurireducens]AXR80326.1 Glutamine transport ATP-binding protein GlnQ [Natrarchaeobaculum sulfurireducens]